MIEKIRSVITKTRAEYVVNHQVPLTDDDLARAIWEALEIDREMLGEIISINRMRTFGQVPVTEKFIENIKTAIHTAKPIRIKE